MTGEFDLFGTTIVSSFRFSARAMQGLGINWKTPLHPPQIAEAGAVGSQVWISVPYVTT
jgi:hypothetical protein